MDTCASLPRTLARQPRRVRIRSLVRLLAPPLCAICAAEADPGLDLCRRCERRLTDGSPPGLSVAGADAAWAARTFVGVARELVAALKFGGRCALAERAASTIAAEAPAWLRDAPLVPVPPSPLRMAWRGFDPAERIALALARRRDLDLSRCLVRGSGPRQVGRPRRERIQDPPRIRPKRSAPTKAVVVDDVATTGATLRASVAALRAAGARQVFAIAFAAAPLEPPRSSSLGSGVGAA
jgi:predicted amidophosphoribosyltransferase